MIKALFHASALQNCNIFPRAGVVLCSNKYLSKCIWLFLLSIVDSNSGASATGATTLAAGKIKFDFGSKRAGFALAKQMPFMRLICSATKTLTVWRRTYFLKRGVEAGMR